MHRTEQLTRLSPSNVKDMFIYAGQKVQENKPFLTKIDSAIGDGDHGIGMSVGFSKAEENLSGKEFQTVNEVFKTIGMSMITSMGGASGVIFGTLFIGGIKGLDNRETLDLEMLTEIFKGSLNAIKERGKAELGDKTMIDALQPAVKALHESVSSNQCFSEGLKNAENSAAQGVENTKNYSAKFGRAKALGERAIGHQDAGATTVWIIFKSMREWVENN
ncbi:dihydroxyacetone kinase subunit DhaL [Oceanobacillus timonensis]|uniref:dihydroxyacetone kinase subunit DhaL n=1 Tax=Oceanobacillus timonensis TaxID=1926285 RepID=UPI001FE51BFB|nr:dihydroxyacetone kinase subunit DhaL [Oceanobacillus timonensis]